MSDAQLIDEYLESVSRALDEAGVGAKHSIVEGLREHIENEISRRSDVDVRSLLGEIGSPSDIASAAGDGEPNSPVGEWREWVAVVLVLLGGYVWGIGWVVGIILIWNSDAWRLRQKVLATFIVPGGLSAAWWWFLATSGPSGCTSAHSNGVTLFSHCVAAPVAEPLRLLAGTAMLLASLGTALMLILQLRRGGQVRNDM